MKNPATNVEQGSPSGGRNYKRADAEDGLRAYRARKRSVCVSALLIITPVAAALAVTRAPVLGFDLILGLACGIANALLAMRAGERVVERRTSLGAFRSSSVLRIFAFGAMPVLAASLGPWWGMGLYFTGFFTPLVLYGLAVQREIRRET